MNNYDEFTNEELEGYERMSPEEKYEMEKILNEMEMDMKMWRKLRKLTCSQFEMLKAMSEEKMKEYLQSRIPRRKSTTRRRVTRKTTKSQYAKSRKTTSASLKRRKSVSPKRKTISRK